MMNATRFQRLIGSAMVVAALFTLRWVLSGRDVQGIGLTVGALLMGLGGLMHVFGVGDGVQSLTNQAPKEEGKDAGQDEA